MILVTYRYDQKLNLAHHNKHGRWKSEYLIWVEYGNIWGYSLMTSYKFRVDVNTFIWKLDGVGPVDNRPSSDKLHHFVRKK